MQHTSCTEDRIQHALHRCLDGLRRSPTAAEHWNVRMCPAGQSMNRWSLEELVKRDPENFLILLQQILRKAREVQEQCQYELLAPLATMFSSTLLQTPYCPPHMELLEEACQVFRYFLTWPEPYCSVCRSLLTTLHQELRAPGISYHRLLREEQGLGTSTHCSKTMTVLLMNPAEVPTTFLSVAEQLCQVQPSQRDTYVTLVKHAYQSALGSTLPLHCIATALQEKSVEELAEIFSIVTDILETSAVMGDPQKGRAHVIRGLEGLRDKLGVQAPNGRKSDGALQTIPVPPAKCHMFHWDKDNFDVLKTLLENESHPPTCFQTSDGLRDEEEHKEDDNCNEEEEEQPEIDLEEEEDEEEEEGEEEEYDMTSIIPSSYCPGHRSSTLSTASKDSMFSTLSIASESYAPSLVSGTDSDFFEDADDYAIISPVYEKSPKASKASSRLSQHFYRLFIKPTSKSKKALIRAKSLCSPDTKELVVLRSKRSYSLPQQVSPRTPEPQPNGQTLRHMCFRRRPILSVDEESKRTTLRVVVFGADLMVGRVARAYSNLRVRENVCPQLSKVFRLQFYFVPVKRDSVPTTVGPACVGSPGAGGSSPLKGTASSTDLSNLGSEDSTNDIAHFIGMLDPWYERNMLSLLHLPVDVVCQQTSKIESESYDGLVEERLPILADLVLYYCRQASRPALVQLYQAELTLAGGERRTEVFIHSLELGHTAGTRAIKAMGAASKRFGIDGDREAVPLVLEVVYNKVVVSGRSQGKREDKVCTSINLTKVCKNPEELDSKMECLRMTTMEVLKRQNSNKSKKGYNQQMNVTEVKVDKVQVTGTSSTTFALCLDQDEKKIFQSVTRCDISVCYKPDSFSDWRLGRRAMPGQIQPLHPSFCSLLCLPITTFSGAQP